MAVLNKFVDQRDVSTKFWHKRRRSLKFKKYCGKGGGLESGVGKAGRGAGRLLIGFVYKHIVLKRPGPLARRIVVVVAAPLIRAFLSQEE